MFWMSYLLLMILSWPTAGCKMRHCVQALAWANCMDNNIWAISLHWPIKHTINYYTRLPCSPISFTARRMAAKQMLALAPCFEWATSCWWSWVGLQQAVRQDVVHKPSHGPIACTIIFRPISSHWPIKHTINHHTRLPCGPISFAVRRMAAEQMLALAHVFNELPLANDLELAHSRL